MPKCQSCGTEMGGNEKFCRSCGAALTGQPQDPPKRGKPSKSLKSKDAAAAPKKKSRKKIVIPVVCVLLTIVIGVGGFFLYTNILMSTDTSVDDYIAGIRQSMEIGQQWSDDGLSVQGDYYYSLAGAGSSSLRYAVEYILFLKGEGENFEVLTEDSRYTGWDTIAEINFSSPYPYYFEGLLYQIQGMDTESAAAYQHALISPNYPEIGLNFYYLRDMEISELYALRDRLREIESSIYSVYRPVISGYPRDPMNGHAEYMRAMSGIALDEGDFELAFTRARLAVQSDPFESEGFVYAAVTAMGCEEYGEAARYIQNGLMIAPQDEGLIKLSDVFTQMYESLPEEGSE